MSTWHYMNNGVQAGPVSTDELRAMLASGAIRSDTLVWRDGMASWLAASTFTEFAGAAPLAAPVVVVPPAGAGAAGSTGVAGTGASSAPGEEIPDPADVEKNKVFGVLSYLPPLLFLVALLTARQSRFAMYHCNQGIVLTIASFAGWFAYMILSAILGFIPILGVLVIMLLGFALMVGVFALAIIGLINAANGRCKPLPLIGNRFTLVK